MKIQQIVDEVLYELDRAKKKWPQYPSDIIHAVAIMNEEAGEAIQAALDYTYDESNAKCRVRDELIQTAAMCFRALEALDDLKGFKQQGILESWKNKQSGS